MRKQTLTIEECLEAFRANLIPISQQTLQAGIKERTFPFADCIVPEKKAVYLIYRKPFYKWLKEHVEEETYVEI